MLDIMLGRQGQLIADTATKSRDSFLAFKLYGNQDKHDFMAPIWVVTC